MSRYQDIVVGQKSLLKTIYYECCIWLAFIPGSLGICLRKIFWPKLFGYCGKGVIFGANIILRHPHRIHLGDRVVISDGCILDARSPSSEQVIVLGDDGILGENVKISCKNGSVEIGDRFGIGGQTYIISVSDNPVSIGSDVVIGPFCYIAGGSEYNTDRIDIPIWKQGKKTLGGSRIEDDVWLGAKVIVLGGVTMGTGSIAGAGAVVTKSIPARAICVGVPAKVIRMRI